MKKLFAPILVAALWVGCSPSGGPADGGNPVPPSQLELEILAPLANVQAPERGQLEVVFRAGLPLGTGRLQLVAEKKAATPGVTASQLPLPSVEVAASDEPQNATMALPEGLVAGTYRLIAVLSDDVHDPVEASFPGLLVVTAAPAQPELVVHEPAGLLRVSRGGDVVLELTAVDPVGASTVTLFADADGDVLTAGDQYELGTTVTSTTAAVQRITASLTGVPYGTWQVLATLPGTPPRLVAAAPGTIEHFDAAFAVQDGGSNTEEGLAVALLADGSVVTTGRFAGFASFGDWPSWVSLSSWGGDDVFVCRYDAAGTLAWVHRGGGAAGGDLGKAVGGRADGSVLVAGYFNGLASFGENGAATTLASSGQRDVFFASYSAAGDLQWGQRAGGVLHDEACGLAVLPDGGFVATGVFRAEGRFGAPATTLVTTGPLTASDAFVVRYDTAGALVWARGFGGTADDRGAAVAVLPDGASVTVGEFRGSMTAGSIGPTTSAGAGDAFVVCHDAAGDVQWLRRGGGVGADDARGVATFADGSSVVVGAFRDLATFDGGAAPVSVQSAGGSDLFVASYDATGNLRWLRSAGGTADDAGQSVAPLADGGCVVGGYFHDSITFALPQGPVTLQATGQRDVFVVRFDAQGSIVWAHRGGGSGSDTVHGVATAADGGFAMTGAFAGIAEFGAWMGTRILVSTGASDVFVTRHNADAGL